MTDLWNQIASNQRLQLIAAALVSGVTVGTLVIGFQALEREGKLHELKRSIGQVGGEPSNLPFQIKSLPSQIPSPKSQATPEDREDARIRAIAQRAQAGGYDEDLILEQLARSRVFLTDDGLARLRSAFVVVVGCGGVGGHCASALVRSGVSRIRLVDFDQVTLSSLNRHAVATLADVGTPKVKCLERRLAAVAPWVRFDLRNEKFDAAASGSLLGPWDGDGDGDGAVPDFVVDAIDNIDSKVALLKYCHDRKLPVIASMGAGCKSDPTRIIVGDIGASTYDRLSRATRRRLKLLGITSGIPAVYSTEESSEGKAALLPVPEEEFAKGAVDDLGVMPNFRVRILPVLGTMPAVFGYTLANHVILSIAGYPSDYVPAKGRDKMYDGILGFLQGSEERGARSLVQDPPADYALGLKVPITVGDVAFLVEEIYRGRSIVTGIATKLVLVRWQRPDGESIVRIGEGENLQKSSNVKLRDLVCMTKEEALRHEKAVLREGKPAEEVYDPKVLEKVAQRMAVVVEYEKYRWKSS